MEMNSQILKTILLNIVRKTLHNKFY